MEFCLIFFKVLELEPVFSEENQKNNSRQKLSAQKRIKVG